MKRDALRLCRRLLNRKRISPDGFSSVVRAIGMFGTKKCWAPRLEAALARQSVRTRRALEGTMLCFYAVSNDWRNALRFASLRRDLSPDELAFATETFAIAGRRAEVICLGRRMERLYVAILRNQRPTEDAVYAINYLLYGLGFYRIIEGAELNEYARSLGAEKAINLWGDVDEAHPIALTAIQNLLDVWLSLILEMVNGRIARVEEADKTLKDDTALSLPGNQQGLFNDMLASLHKHRRNLERLVPEKRRRELAMGSLTNNDSDVAGDESPDPF